MLHWLHYKNFSSFDTIPQSANYNNYQAVPKNMHIGTECVQIFFFKWKIPKNCCHLQQKHTQNNMILTHNHFTDLFRDHPGEPVPEENFWTLWCKGRLTEADTPTIWLGATPSRLTVLTSTIPHIFYGSDAPFLPPNQQCQSTEGKITWH